MTIELIIGVTIATLVFSLWKFGKLKIPKNIPVKRIKIFLRLKWDETVGVSWEYSKLTVITYVISVPIYVYFGMEEGYPFIGAFPLAMIMSIGVPLLILFCKDVGPDFLDWIKDNWEKAGKKSGDIKDESS